MSSFPVRLSTFPTLDIYRDGSFERTDFVTADVPGTLCLALGEKYLKAANANPAIACIVTSADLAPQAREDLGIVIAGDPQKAFFEIHNEMVLERQMRPAVSDGIDPSAKIHPSAAIEDEVSIGSNVVIEAGAVIKRNTVLEDGVLIGAGCLIGIEGHFYKRFEDKLFRVEHGGGVVVGEGSQILAGTSIQKALFPTFTAIGSQTVVSVGAQIAHGVVIGNRCTITGSVQIAGYTRIGDDVWIGPSAAIGNLLTIGDGSRVEIGSVLTKSIPAGSRYSGPFAMPHTRNLRLMAQWAS
jgi:UDP-3-O-[3-hydroxymyristoyl] glucosamine N-acyltransferase